MKYNRIKDVSEDTKRSQKWLADQLDVSVVTVSNWYRNQKQPSLESIFRISDVLQCKPSELKKALSGNLIGKISSLLNTSNLKKFKKRLDPRLYNGAIFIGLDSPVVKSHGGTDFIGFSNSLDVCCRIIKGDLIEKIKKNI